MAYMVPGFLIPTEGRVLVDGVDTRNGRWTPCAIRPSYVFQEHLLLSGSVFDNLRLGRPTASRSGGGAGR